MTYQHTYNVTVCPHCAIDLTGFHAIEIEGMDNEGKSLGTSLE